MSSLPSLQTDFFALLHHLNELKHLKRTGWVHFGVPEPETVASHMHRMALLAMTLQQDGNVDAVRCIKIALVHDIGEAIVGDITPRCGISNDEKFRLEDEAVKKIADTVPQLQSEIYTLWQEYEKAETPEAKVVKQLDKLDMIAQALTYELKYKIDLSEFFNATVNSFITEPFISWNKQIREKREQNRVQ
ncbi:5'-deoxynucleotidase HDDC2 [Aphelenchoides besseyi]|nr:5'-deoxynucleotidase HDDC2 [Aphelenchoides besseyi]